MSSTIVSSVIISYHWKRTHYYDIRANYHGWGRDGIIISFGRFGDLVRSFSLVKKGILEILNIEVWRGLVKLNFVTYSLSAPGHRSELLKLGAC